ncbi:PP0621 family protein [Paucibacter sp. R3-3]|uniref:PP0621 family protein n=1 Tax=Roseateles agri TaxID=3098619 RepID=A0ABU5DC21_9BURK|nr:PP0621 family protein [Paucibacter sp. R3-3]MDY0743268.1 PP0621 family protein [Paucibacter sp. R3-3]
MKFLLIVIVIAVVAFMLGAKQRTAEPEERRSTPPTPPPPAPPKAIVRCAQCGLHLPQDEALPGRGGMFCGAAHRTAYEAASGPQA